jgi:hypothetical protein
LRNTLPCLIAPLLVLLGEGSGRADALAKLKPDKLEAVRQAIQALQTQRRKVPQAGPYKEYRANLHVHSALSHDSRGTLTEIVVAARAVGTRVVLFTEHPADHYDFFKDGHRGTRDGVLLIPGAEANGFLIFPTRSLRGLATRSAQEFADVARRDGGLVFLSHLEERLDWEIRGLTGTEVYNTHADFKDEKKLIAALRNPLWIIQSMSLFRKYPQEAFSALQDYPAQYLQRWDDLCRTAPHTGVAANDAHQNVGLSVRLVAGDKVRLEDALGKQLLELSANVLPSVKDLCKDKRIGDVVFQIKLDSYENSLRHVGTHLLLTELSENAVREALQAGRAFIAFDWLADASGFNLAVWSGDRRHEMGSRLSLGRGLSLRGRAPLAGHWKILRNGKVQVESTGDTLDFPVAEPGCYRVEVWLRVANENMIWILSNPWYVRPARQPELSR